MHFSTYPFVNLSIHPSIHPSLYLFTYCIYLSIYLPIYLPTSISLPIYLFIPPSISLWCLSCLSGLDKWFEGWGDDKFGYVSDCILPAHASPIQALHIIDTHPWPIHALMGTCLFFFKRIYIMHTKVKESRTMVSNLQCPMLEWGSGADVPFMALQLLFRAAGKGNCLEHLFPVFTLCFTMANEVILTSSNGDASQKITKSGQHPRFTRKSSNSWKTISRSNRILAYKLLSPCSQCWIPPCYGQTDSMAQPAPFSAEVQHDGAQAGQRPLDWPSYWICKSLVGLFRQFCQYSVPLFAYYFPRLHSI